MANNENSIFGEYEKKRLAKQAKPSDSTAEMSRAERMTKARQAVNESGTNAFTRNAPPKPVAPVVAAIPAAVKTNFGGREDDRLRVARKNEQARRAALKKDKEEQALIPQYAVQTQEEISVVCKGWIAARPAFHVSKWNVEMLNRAVFYLISVSKGSWNFITLDAAFQHLAENNHLEAESRVRGAMPPVEFAIAQKQPEAMQRVIRKTEVTASEMAALRNVPFDELQQASRLLMKK